MDTKHRSPRGHKIVYETRRHWYEILPETADALFWISLICMYSMSLSWLLFYPPALGFLILIVFPLGHLVKELVLWNHEWYIVAKMQSGKGKLFKTSGVFSRKTIEDFIDDVAMTIESNLLGRMFGFVRVQVKSPNHTFIEGRLVPEDLVKAIHLAQIKRPAIPENEDPKSFVMGAVSTWVEDGILDPKVASMATERWVLESLQK